MAQYLSPFAGRQFLNANGDPYVGALLFTYVAGSSTKVTTTKDSAGASNHTNPIVLNARGEPSDGAGASQAIWQTGGAAVKYVLAPSTDSDPPLSAISTWDNISGINDASTTIDQWIAGPTPIYVGATQFTLVGDQTNIFHVGRRIKATVTAGTVYGTITVSAYTALTTITVVLDSGALDSGLSTVYYGILTATNSSIPGVEINGDDWTHQGNVTHEGTVTLVSKAINEAKGANVASVAGTTDIWTPADGQTVHITGTNAMTGFGTAPQAGAIRHCIADAACSIVDGANLVCPGGDIQCQADDAWDVYADTTTKMYVLNYTRADGSALILGSRTQSFTTAGTFTNGFTIPATEIFVTIVAGGGGGGAEDNHATGCGGGGAGAGIKEFYMGGLTIGALLDVVVGAAGAGGTVPGAGAGTDGGVGGSSIVRVGGGGAAYITCTGGGGGGGQTAAVFNGGAVGTCTIAGVQGNAGEAGAASNPGDGGASIFGVGGTGANPGGTPAVTSYGAGGGGGWNGAGAAAGGAGRPGAVIFRW